MWIVFEQSLDEALHGVIMKKSRNTYLDIVKGVAMLLVVCGHSIQYGNGVSYLDSEQYFDNWLYKFIYTFHMPLFMLVSGYLFCYSINKYDTATLLKNKFRGLLLPIFSFGVIVWFVPIIKWIAGNGVEGVPCKFFSFVFLNYHLWFLWSVLLNSIITILVHKLNDPLYIYVVIWFLLMLIPEQCLHGLYSWTYPFFVMGYIANKASLPMKFQVNIRNICFLSLLYVVLLLFFDKDSYAYISGQFILREDGIYYLYQNAYRFLIGLTGSALILCLIKWGYDHAYKDKKYIVFLSSIGQCSLGIYCFQDLLFYLFKRCIIVYVDDNNIIAPLLTFIIVGGFSFLLTYFLRNYRYTNLFLFGGR